MKGELQEESISLVAVGKFETKGDRNALLLQQILHERIQRETFPGPEYIEWLERFQKKLKPRTYLEIGVESGYSLQFAKEPTRSIGIDPDPGIRFTIKSPMKLFALNSDDFFKEYNLTNEFDGLPVSLAFIDGLHEYDQALRDFFNIERHSTKSTIVLLHDVQGAIPEISTRDRETNYWAGDTWKIMHVLKEYRPDLTIATIPTYPTSLGVITNLNPNYSYTKTDFNEMVKFAENLKFDENVFVGKTKNDFAIVDRLLKI